MALTDEETGHGELEVALARDNIRIGWVEVFFLATGEQFNRVVGA